VLATKTRKFTVQIVRNPAQLLQRDLKGFDSNIKVELEVIFPSVAKGVFNFGDGRDQGLLVQGDGPITLHQHLDT